MATRTRALAGSDTATWTPGAVGLVDLLDRVLAGGVAVSGDVVICLAGVDLIRLDLRLLLASVGNAPFEDNAPKEHLGP
jgi:hypothetical protein